jgi:hypothetical protein
VITCGAWAETGNFAAADSANLAGGVLIAHRPTAMVWSTDVPPEGWCAQYVNQYGITAANQQVNRIDGAGSSAIWFVLAAWAGPKKFCGAEFGMGTYDPAAFVLTDNGACGNNFTPLTLPGTGWPGPNTGFSMSAPPGGSWRGNYVPVYYFAGYAYDPGTTMPITANPTTQFGGIANCAIPSVQIASECFGIMGILQDGHYCEPPTVVPGACCFGGGDCQLVLQDQCDVLGGTWDGSAQCTEPNPCPVTWACCIHDEATGAETCQMETESSCTALGGRWHLSATCGQGFTCPLIRACCLEQQCYLYTEAECTTASGTWHSDAFSCTTPSDPCLLIRACCIGTDCQLMTQPDCLNAAGRWLQNESACTPADLCVLRACCFGTSCQLLTQSECLAESGVWKADYDACVQPGDLCPPIVPVDNPTWGRIKAIYR